MKRLIYGRSLCGLIVLLLVVSAGCKKSASNPSSPSSPSQGNSNSVSIQNMAFSPASITVAINTPVAWTNNDNVAHTVTSNTGLFNSGNISAGGGYSGGGSYSFKF